MYISGAILPVPQDKREEYKQMAEKMDDMFLAHGAIETMDAWEVDVADGKVTDMRRAVAAQEGEAIIFAWIVWPDKETCDTAFAAMQADPDLAESGPPPFDGMRAIFGGFEPLVRRNNQAADS